jgi:signal recognition particle subunit SRP19
MALDEDKAWVLWPEYFDSDLTRDAGRKVKKELAVASPTTDMLAKALMRLNLEFKVEADKSYPGDWFAKRGRVLVERSLPKSELLTKVAEILARAQRS